MFTSEQIRQQFIDYFIKKRSHTFAPSSPVVPHDDPTLLFANAGMNQFKPIFLGQVDPTSDLAKLTRACNSQKCIRAGGKHNDLDDVGKDFYHHTFFEMLGNWSFGDYFKEEAIQWAWELLTKEWGIDANRLYATYFGGDKAEGLKPDAESRELWLKYLPPERVLPGSMKDNFWEMGDTGPCGPCSEIHYDGRSDDERAKLPGRELVNNDHGDVIELWNLVFIQYNRVRAGADGLRPLPARHVDTGLGLERIVRVLQGKRSNYDTDLFTPIFAKIQEITGADAYTGDLEKPADIAYRVIGDHIRTLVFAITDGADPSNEGRGYVLRRILRRAVRHGRQTLGAKGSFLCELAPTVVEMMGGFFPELTKNPQRVIDVLREEEESFGRTLDRGIELFHQAGSRETISASDAFKLHDTYGFPIDLTQIMAEERGLTVDVAGFEKLMEEARERSRAGGGSIASTDTISKLPTDAVASLAKLHVKPTDDSAKYNAALRPLQATVRAIWNGSDFDENVEAAHTRPTDRFAVILDKTSLYANAGGQVGDTGRLKVAREAHTSVHDKSLHGEMIVEDTRVTAGYVLHIGRVKKGEIRVGDLVEIRHDKPRRLKIMSNHTATHLLNFALRETLGDTINQKGSLVAPDRLRFDFSHNRSITSEEGERIARLVRESIAADLPVYVGQAALSNAKRIAGVRAVFGEKYPDPVRVVSIGAPIESMLESPDNLEWRGYSVEFCGGTHVPAAGEIQAFAVTEEEAVSKGVRRIVCLTGDAAQQAIDAGVALRMRVEKAAMLEGEALESEVQAISSILDSETLPMGDKAAVRRALEDVQGKLKKARKESAAAGRDQAVAAARTIAEAGDFPTVVAEIPAGGDRGALLAAMDVVRAKCPDAAVMLFSVDAPEGKISIAANVPKALIDAGFKAGDWVKSAAQACGGKGGGRAHGVHGVGIVIIKL